MLHNYITGFPLLSTKSLLSLLQTTGHHLETCNLLGWCWVYNPWSIFGLFKSDEHCSLKYFCLHFVFFKAIFFLFLSMLKLHKTANRHQRQTIYSALSKLAEKALTSQVYPQVKRHPILIWLAASFLTVKYGLCLKFQGLEISSLLKGPKHLRQQLWIVSNAGAGFRVSVFMRRPNSVHCLTKHLDGALIWKVDFHLLFRCSKSF